MGYILNYVNEVELPDFKEIAEKNYFRTDPLKSVVLERGIVLPPEKENGKLVGGVLEESGDFAKFSKDDLQTAVIEKGYLPKEVLYDDREVIYLGLYNRHWGYFITNIVTRLWRALKEEKIENVYIAYTVLKENSMGTEIDGNYLEFFKILGIPEEHLLLVKEPTRFRKVILAEHAYVPGDYYTSEFKEFYDYIKSKVNLNEPIYEKVYFARVGNKKADARDYGEEQFIKIFRDAGYYVVEPEGKSLQEQIWLLKNAKHIACVSGTLLHNLLFASDGVEVTTMNRQAMPMLSHFYQGGINQMRNAQVTILDASLRILPVNGAGPNIYYISDLMCKYLDEKGFVYEKPDYKKNSLKGHLVLIWYFFKWLDFYNKNYPNNLARITGQLDERSVQVYSYYRDEIGDWYDNEEGRKQRNLLYQLINLL